MQIKNRKANIIVFILSFLFVCTIIRAEEFNISAKEITVDKENNIVIGKGEVEVKDKEGKIIKSNKVTYEKSIEFLTVEGKVEIFDSEGNILKTDEATFDKLKNLIITKGNSSLFLSNGYELATASLLYDNTNKIIKSDQKSIFTDIDKNIVTVDMFQYKIEKKLFSSIGNIKIEDINNNKYFFKQLHVDTDKREMIGSDVNVILDQENFGVSEDNDPRFAANDIFVSKNYSSLSKGVFTVCKKKEDGCPPWSLQAKKIKHDKLKKTIYYENAVLKVYDIPIFYFPRFFHPDPTVKRQSGFLTPFFTTSTSVGNGFGLPYYWAISNDKDVTFTPKIYSKENPVILNEYRQAFKNGFLTIDASYTEGYKNTTSTKTSGSRNHLFAELDLDLAKNSSYESNLSFKIQKTSNDTYFRIHDINTSLVDSSNTDLKNEINYNLNKNNAYLNISGIMYEDLRKETNSRYEYILPNILFGKSFFSEKFGTIDLKSNTVYRNFDTNKHLTSITNDIIWNPGSYITKNGFVNTLEGMFKNINYDAKNTTDYKTEGTVNELSSVLSFKSSFPLQKKENLFTKIFSPSFMIRYAPGHMRKLTGEDFSLKYANLYSTNKTSVIEDGLSGILGFDYKINKANSTGKNEEKLSLSVGQVYSLKENNDMPAKSSLNKKMSDIVGEINYNFSEIGNIGYKFSLDDNLNDLNYNEISTTLNFGKIDFNLDYLEEQNHVGQEHYINSGITLNLNNNNSFSFATKKNYKTDSTEFYDIKYQYMIDCLTAGLVYRREFYEDTDVEQKNTLMFTITFVPFTGARAPLINP